MVDYIYSVQKKFLKGLTNVLQSSRLIFLTTNEAKTRLWNQDSMYPVVVFRDNSRAWYLHRSVIMQHAQNFRTCTFRADICICNYLSPYYLARAFLSIPFHSSRVLVRSDPFSYRIPGSDRWRTLLKLDRPSRYRILWNERKKERERKKRERENIRSANTMEM